jgi:hypothetical protein
MRLADEPTLLTAWGSLRKQLMSQRFVVNLDWND